MSSYTDTDSEVVVHLISYYIDEGLDNNLAVRKALQRLRRGICLRYLIGR